MKVLLQRVARAGVRVDGVTVGAIGRGLLVFLGVEAGDTADDAAWYADKTAELRIFADDDGKMNRSVEEAGGAILVVSQFTLAASTRRGRRPSFETAAVPEEAEARYLDYVGALGRRGIETATGRFRAMMEVELVNDGPVTILLDPRGDAR
ncbi:MAG TPA: D-aminoacyl-tRNA deacylase [Candidatus Polarisedimenticolaceae bacterium]|nr:D-aminoacyl-tRNA deacylase [Candidatus Polarisedimenticolaceae bacterium]